MNGQNSIEEIVGFVAALKKDSAEWLRSYWRRVELLEEKYNPAQPRVPAGSNNGGAGTGGSGSDSRARQGGQQGAAMAGTVSAGRDPSPAHCITPASPVHCITSPGTNNTLD